MCSCTVHIEYSGVHSFRAFLLSSQLLFQTIASTNFGMIKHTLILLGLAGLGQCGVPLVGVDPALGSGLAGYEAAVPQFGPGPGYGIPDFYVRGYGYGIGHGYGNGHYSRPAALYDSYNDWKPIIKKPIVVKPFLAPVVHKPVVPFYKPTHFTVTPSLSYGYSYKLVPTYAYGPAVGLGLGHPGVGHGFGYGLGYGYGHGHEYYK